jgi:hypothetical protein
VITLVAISIAAILFYLGQHAGAFLIIFGVAAKYLSPFILTVVSLPGRFVAFPNNSDKQSKTRLALGTIISIFAQSCVYLVYAAFIVNWTISAISNQAASLMIWPIAFLSVIVSFGFALNEFRKSVKETEHASKDMPEATKKVIGGPEIRIFSMLAQASLISFFLTMVGFFIFVFVF